MAMPTYRGRFTRFLIKQLVGRRFMKAEGSVSKLRSFDESLARSQRPPKGTRVRPQQVNGLQAKWVHGPGAGSDEVILYSHGGGFVMGSPSTHLELASRISSGAGVGVLSLDYRLAPEHPFPAASGRCQIGLALASGSGLRASPDRRRWGFGGRGVGTSAVAFAERGRCPLAGRCLLPLPSHRLGRFGWGILPHEGQDGSLGVSVTVSEFGGAVCWRLSRGEPSTPAHQDGLGRAPAPLDPGWGSRGSSKRCRAIGPSSGTRRRPG
jgi:hypothetical protein